MNDQIRETDAPERSGALPSEAPQRGVFPTPGDVLLMLGIVFGAQIAVGLLTGAVLFAVFGPGFDYGADPALTGRISAVTYALSMSLALVALWGFRRARGGARPAIGLSLRGFDPRLLAWAFVLILGLGAVLEPLVAWLPGPSYDRLGRGWGAVLALAVFAPLFEETICRGLVLGSLRAKYGVVAAWVFSSLFFGVLHLYPAQAIVAAVIGLVLGYVYIASGSLWAPMLLHAANNLCAYLLLAAGQGDRTLRQTVGDDGWYAAIYAAAAVLVLVSGWMVRRRLRRLAAESENRPAAY